MQLVTDAELAALAGVSARRIRQLAEQGTLERVERGRYALGPSVQALIEDAAGTGSELQRERTRKVRADADRAELAFATERKLVAPVELMHHVMASVFGEVRANMRNIPERAVTQLIGETDQSRFKQVMRSEIDAALVSLASHDFKNFTQPNDLEPQDHEPQ